MSGEPTWVEATEVLVRELERIGARGFSLDTEADSLHHFREKVCLIQISTRDADLLIDPLSGLDLEPLRPLLADPGRRKLLHGADYDLRMLRRDFSFALHGIYDTMVAARLVGERAFGLAALLDKHLNVHLDKRFQRADWSRRPLSGPMRQYAAADTRHLEDMAGILDGKLQALGRSGWAAEEFQRLEQVRQQSETAPRAGYTRVKGVARLGRRALAVLREVVALRDGIARKRDLPRFRVVRDDVLLALSETASRQHVDPAGFPGLPRAWRSGELAAALRQGIERALALPQDQWPESLRRVRPERDPALEARVRELCKQRDRLATGLGLEGSVLAPRALLETAARRLDRGESVAELPELRRWQFEILGPLFDALA